MGITIRQAHDRDTERICAGHKASITTLCSRHYTPEQIAAWAGPRTPEDYQRPIRELVVLVAECGEALVGFSIFDPRSGEIHALYLDPRHVRQGHGTELLEAMEARARAAGLSTVTLNATLNSVPFYEARGFSFLREATNTLPSGVALPCARMEKQLSPSREK